MQAHSNEGPHCNALSEIAFYRRRAERWRRRVLPALLGYFLRRAGRVVRSFLAAFAKPAVNSFARRLWDLPTQNVEDWKIRWKAR